MNTNYNADIVAMVAHAKKTFEATQQVIDGMKDGERIQLKDLAKDVGLALALDPKLVLGFVHHFAHNNSSAYVTRGKNGGVIKGVKPVRVVKVKKKVESVNAPTLSLDQMQFNDTPLLT